MIGQKDNIIDDTSILKINGEYVAEIKITGEMVYKFTEVINEKPPTEILPTAILIDQGTSITLKKGNTMQLTATIAPANATDKTVNWTSSNQSILSVSKTGLVSSINTGMATITAKTSNNITKTIIIRVTA